MAVENEVDMRWKDLYRIGGIASVAMAVMIVLAIVAFVFWPFLPGEVSTREIFMSIQDNLLGGLMALDFPLLVIELVAIVHFLALYAALKRVNESYALIGLTLGLIAVTLIIAARPIHEMVYLSEKYTTAENAVAKARYLAAGEAFHALFNGTAFLVFTLFIAISGLISSLLMLRSNIFSRATAVVGIAATAPSLLFFIPKIGLVMLFVATIMSIPWLMMQARTFIRLGWSLR
ncbi:MAG: DUF4386 family protein [Chitinivibrionales bacterium]|nr:DUF4386 family protein [Chitinivibrionales bacterium]MBD3356519.1 DUF4386 family protein [Chitinivibrionales bacterium]